MEEPLGGVVGAVGVCRVVVVHRLECLTASIDYRAVGCHVVDSVTVTPTLAGSFACCKQMSSCKRKRFSIRVLRFSVKTRAIKLHQSLRCHVFRFD
ncbi:hypothetical protein E2C01_044870 [Portunus trituberculatus]|uniref:Uncharacterized protein n=1 Tax=Portunus trituberculatus TaxID=210409 RepID=A0A5B7G1A3_PORTR|nr:hypothetical protein [Portunus trituberculatus]